MAPLSSTPKPAENQNPELSITESLLIAQAVWLFGAAPPSWTHITSLLSRHPMIARPKSFFNVQSCQEMFNDLLRSAGLERSDANNVPKCSENLQVAKKYYELRLAELHQLIKAEEAKFKMTMSEIEDIRSGAWDEKIKIKSEMFSGSEPKKSAVPSGEEIDDDSDLSGVTDSASASSVLHDENTIKQTKSGEEMEKDVIVIEDGSPTPEAFQMQEITNDTSEEPWHVPAENQKSAPSLTNKALNELEGDKVSRTEFPEKINTVSEENKFRESVLEEQNISQTFDKEEGGDRKQNVAETNVEEMCAEQETAAGDDMSNNQESIEAVSVNSAQLEGRGVSDTENDGISSGEEPLKTTRRSARNRKLSATPTIVPARGKGRERRPRPLSEIEPSPEMEIDGETDTEITVDTAHLKDERVSSPALSDLALFRRRQGKRKASFLEGNESPRDSKRNRDDSEPVDDDESTRGLHGTLNRVTRQNTRTEEQMALKRFQYVIGLLHSQISQHRNGAMFHHPIKNSDAPDYSDIVKRPIDLKTIKAKVKDGLIDNSLEYQKDIYLMFANSMVYNRPGSAVYAMAEDMMLESEVLIRNFRQTEGLVRGAHLV